MLAPKYTGMRALRHWFESWCINEGVWWAELSPKALQTRMEHNSIKMTIDIYGQLFSPADEAQALAAAEILPLA